MKNITKVILTIILVIVAIFFMGMPIPYFYGRIFLQIALVGIPVWGIIAIWRKKTNQ